MLKVRDIMTRRVISLAGDAPVEAAAWQLSAEKVSGAPVRDARGHLIGMVSKSDLVELLCHEREDDEVVKDIMTPGIWAVHPDAPALDAVRMMLDQHIHRVLVMHGPDRVEGIVTAMDVMRALVRGMDFDPVPNYRVSRPEGDEAGDAAGDAGAESNDMAVSAERRA